VSLIFFYVLATWALQVIQKSPVFHHLAHAKKSANMFGHPQLKVGRRVVCCHFKRFPINILKSNSAEHITIMQVCLELFAHNGTEDSFGGVQGNVGPIDHTVPSFAL
jgi:hypothetical protein